MKRFIITVIAGAIGNVTETLKMSENHTRKTLNRLSSKKSCTRDMTHNMESDIVRNLKPEWRGEPLVQEKYQGKGDLCYKR
jgi:hypothetical protein